MFAISTNNELLRFDSETPTALTSSVAISGLQGGESIVGIDFRPATGQLYGLGSTSRLYTIDLQSGLVTQVGSPFSTALAGTDFGFDFNPTANRIRIVSNTEQNLRINPDNGNVAADDTPLSYASGDLNSGANPGIACVAYTNNFSDADSTTLFAIDVDLDTLALIGSEGATPNSPNNGELTTEGQLGFDTTARCGLDISGKTGQMFASLTPASGIDSTLFRIDAGTGNALTKLGTIGDDLAINDIAVPISESTGPSVIITAPSAANIRTRRSRYTVRGTAADNVLVSQVLYRTVRDGRATSFKAATGVASWAFTLSLREGVTTVQVKAIDLFGNESALSSVNIRRLEED